MHGFLFWLYQAILNAPFISTLPPGHIRIIFSQNLPEPEPDMHSSSLRYGFVSTKQNTVGIRKTDMSGFQMVDLIPILERSGFLMVQIKDGHKNTSLDHFIYEEKMFYLKRSRLIYHWKTVLVFKWSTIWILGS